MDFLTDKKQPLTEQVSLQMVRGIFLFSCISFLPLIREVLHADIGCHADPVHGQRVLIGECVVDDVSLVGNLSHIQPVHNGNKALLAVLFEEKF